MGNPRLRSSAFARPAAPAPPPTAVPPLFPELRQCALCALCEELRPERTTADRMVAVCAWQGDWWFPRQGCDRWQFEPAWLGDEGAD